MYVISVILLILSLVSLGLALVAGADPEGRGGDYVMKGLSLAAVFFICFVVCACLAVKHSLGA